MPSAVVSRPPTITRPFCSEQDEQRPDRPLDPGPRRASAAKRARDRRAESRPASASGRRGARPHRSCSRPPRRGGSSGTRRTAHARLLDGQHVGRTGALGRDDEGRADGEHALGRERAQVADIRLLLAAPRADSRLVVSTATIRGSRAERVEDLGDGAAERDDAVGTPAQPPARAGSEAQPAAIRGRGGSAGHGSFGQDQLVVGGDAQPVALAAVQDDDLAAPPQEGSRADPPAPAAASGRGFLDLVGPCSAPFG